MNKIKTIDCLLIGHNDVDFQEYEKNLRKMGMNSGAYRDLNLNFIWYENKPYSLSEMFNLLFHQESSSQSLHNKMNFCETFNAAIAYLGTYLNRRQFTFDYVNDFQEEKEELAKKLEQENIRTIAITTTLYTSPLPIVEIMEFIKKHNRGAKIIIGGPFVSTQVRTLEPVQLEYLWESLGADYYVNSSQGEKALVNILTALKDHCPLGGIPNIYYKTGNGYAAGPRVTENNILSENMVNWDLFSPGPGRYVNVRTAISCPFSCAFCGFPEHAGKYQAVPAAAIEKELNLLAKIKSVKSIHFIDDTFNVPLKRFKDILKMLIKNKYTFKWHSHFRSQFSDRETVELMKKSGCEGVFLGFESGNNQMLKKMNKAAAVEKYHEGIALLKEAGITTFGSFIIGFPGETPGTVQDTVTFIEESEIDFFRAQSWFCEHITPIWRDRKKYHLEGRSFEWKHETMDSYTAADLVEKIFLSVKNSVWVPQYNFDFDNIFHLTDRGMTVDRVKSFLNSFNRGVREKMDFSDVPTDPNAPNVSLEVIKELMVACGKPPHFDKAFVKPKEEKSDRLEKQISFEF
ncbi:MAG: PhpK family radical SAM P-methyltransferase [Candidatus Aminicenantes bacterium]|nr:MAG: PhpK family radical SAM P-methyltransferase [Candidatus Aminicenantes bacterium]